MTKILFHLLSGMGEKKYLINPNIKRCLRLQIHLRANAFVVLLVCPLLNVSGEKEILIMTEPCLLLLLELLET